MISDVISKPVYRILSDLTQESAIEVALLLAIKDWVRLKLKETQNQRTSYELRYDMDFVTFKQKWEQGTIENEHSYEVEQDYWEWEASVTDEQRLTTMLDSLA